MLPCRGNKARMEPDSAEAAPAGAQKRKTHPLAPRIKRLMQTDEDVGKIAQATPHLIGTAYKLDALPHMSPPQSSHKTTPPWSSSQKQLELALSLSGVSTSLVR